MKNIQYIAEGITLYRSVVEAILLIALTSFALFNDIKYYKIPNKLNFCFLVIGLLFNAITGCIGGSLIGMFVPFVLFPLFALRMMGAGDIKLFCAIGAIVGYPHIINAIVYAVIANGLIALVIMLIRKNTDGFKRLWQWCTFTVITGQVVEYQAMDKNSKNIFRYACGIMVGCLYYIVTTLILGGSYALL
jgi:prepilin peptidase CpaA